MSNCHCQFSKDKDPEYVRIYAYYRKICTTKALLKLHLKVTHHHSYDVVGQDESETEIVVEVEGALGYP